MADGNGNLNDPSTTGGPGSGNRGGPGKGGSRSKVARDNWAYYEYAKQRGHIEYCEVARRNEDFYLGGGLQWSTEDRDTLERAGRPALEFNEIADAINTALGNQVSNRVNISYRPRGNGADDEVATTLSKVAMQVCDNNDFRHQETDVTADGFIQQRGYFDIRIEHDTNLYGEIKVTTLDPMDVIPDPDAKSYDPDSWGYVIVTRWLTLDEIESYYGSKARREVEEAIDFEGNDDFGQSEGDGIRRSKFGDDDSLSSEADLMTDDKDIIRVRIVDRQHWRMANTEVALYPTGDIRVIEDATEGARQAAIQQGAMLFRRPMRRVRWTVSSYGEVLLHDGWSPYQNFTVVPYFPFFRRGRTRGLIDNAIDPQQMLNKAISQYVHIISTTANSGWIVEENSLSNMATDDLETEGSATGLTIEFRKGSTAPKKIEPNQVPTGVDKLVAYGSQKIRTVTGISDAMRGAAPSGQSGKAIQSLQFGSQMSLAVPLDNLARTRTMVARRLLQLIQGYMDYPQLMRIVDRDEFGEEATEEMKLNWLEQDGRVLNDLTLGEYDVVISEQPQQVTFDNSQFDQAMALKEAGAPIPWSYIMRMSNLADRTNLARMARDVENQPDPNAEAEAALAQARAAQQEAAAALAHATATAKRVESMFSAVRTAATMRSDPALSTLADVILGSAGFVDQDSAPLMPDTMGLPPAAGVAPPVNTNPITPDNPDRGMNAGIENGNLSPVTTV